MCWLCVGEGMYLDCDVRSGKRQPGSIVIVVLLHAPLIYSRLKKRRAAVYGSGQNSRVGSDGAALADPTRLYPTRDIRTPPDPNRLNPTRTDPTQPDPWVVWTF